MNRKIFGIFISLLFVASLTASINVDANQNNIIENEPPEFGTIIAVGVMDLIEDAGEYRDFEIHVAVILEESIDIFIAETRALRLYNPHGLFLDSVVVAFCDSWELV
jgi:hypothetical protein